VKYHSMYQAYVSDESSDSGSFNHRSVWQTKAARSSSFVETYLGAVGASQDAGGYPLTAFKNGTTVSFSLVSVETLLLCSSLNLLNSLSQKERAGDSFWKSEMIYSGISQLRYFAESIISRLVGRDARSCAAHHHPVQGNGANPLKHDARKLSTASTRNTRVLPEFPGDVDAYETAESLALSATSFYGGQPTQCNAPRLDEYGHVLNYNA
jgi:hypothetical protein